MRLVVQINNTRPVNLADFSNGMLALASEYKRFSADGGEHMELTIREMRKGSIIAELGATLVAGISALPMIVDQAHQIVAFAERLAGIIDWAKGLSKQAPEADRKTLENVHSILEPVAKDGGSQLIIQAHDGANVSVNYVVSSVDANAAQNGLGRDLKALEVPIRAEYYSVLFRWHQARSDPKSKAGDRGIIERIYRGSVKVRFADDMIKRLMLNEPEHPFEKGYVVNVEVDTIDGRPALYHITELHEVIDFDSLTKSHPLPLAAPES